MRPASQSPPKGRNKVEASAGSATTMARLVFALVVRFQLSAGSEEAFDRLIAATAARIQVEEPGTLLYLCHSVQGQVGARIFYELYRDRAAFQVHEEQTYIKAFLEERQRYLASEPRVEFLEPADGKGWPDR
jgi:quinol monooxygenase YgiN